MEFCKCRRVFKILEVLELYWCRLATPSCALRQCCPPLRKLSNPPPSFRLGSMAVEEFAAGFCSLVVSVGSRAICPPISKSKNCVFVQRSKSSGLKESICSSADGMVLRSCRYTETLTPRRVWFGMVGCLVKVLIRMLFTTPKSRRTAAEGVSEWCQ